MDIYERYSEAEIQSIRELIDCSLDEKGVAKTMELIESFQTQKTFWKMYDEDREKEKMEEEFAEKGNQFNNLIRSILRPFDGPRTKKLDEEKEEAMREGTKELEKIWDIASNDEDTKERIAEAVEDLEYDEESIDSRMNVTKSLISTINMLQTAELFDVDFEKVYDAVNYKLNEINFRDFAIAYLSSNRVYLCTNPKFKETMLQKIENMSNYEFAYFLLTTEDGMDGRDPQIIEKKKSKTEKCNSNFINEVYNNVRLRDMPKIEDNNEVKDKKVIDKVEELYKTDDSQQKLELFSALTDTELLRYFIHYKNRIEYMDKDLVKSDIMTNKLEGFSRKNMIALTEVFLQTYIDYEFADLEDEGGVYFVNQLEDPIEKIFGEVKKRKLINDNLDVQYSAEEARIAKEEIEFYTQIDKKIPHSYVRFKPDVDPDDGDINWGSVDDILEGRYKEADDQMKEILGLYYALDQLSNTPDLKMLQEVNKYNLKYRMSQFKNDATNNQKYLINYFKRRIIGLPTSYGSFLQIIEGGCLNDAMELKAEELQYKLSENQNGEKQNDANQNDK